MFCDNRYVPEVKLFEQLRQAGMIRPLALDCYQVVLPVLPKYEYQVSDHRIKVRAFKPPNG